MLKMTENSKCACNIKTFNSKKEEKKENPKPIKKISDKKAEEIKERGSFLKFYANLAKWHFNKYGDGVCEYCSKTFNIERDFIDNRVAFAHILAKWDPLYKHLCTFKNNIAIVCSEKCHKSMDAEICRLWIKNILKEKIERLEKIDVRNLSSYL